MQLIVKPLSELTPAPYNPRVDLEPGDRRYRKLKRSLEQFGLVEPLVWNQTTGHLVGGHQRVRILRELGYEAVEVSVVELPVPQEKALNILLNNREAQGDWNLERLTMALEELASVGTAEYAATGFDAHHLQTLQAQLTPDPDAETEPASEEVCEITLRIPLAQLQAVRPELDDLLEKYQLTAHVRQR
ncbi:MAG: ParB N-terminal domain-containing protein [Gemmatales bacterium]